jgi:PKD repeat protein|tara:strand:- start:234 stop:707 length:474 start_codon:yes stop_codon:yes gene_type:complete
MNNLTSTAVFYGLFVLMVFARQSELSNIEEERQANIVVRQEAEAREMEEAEKYKDAVDHDSDPKTTTYPVVLDASKSRDPDQGDKLTFSWVQTAGEVVELSSTKGKIVTFAASSGQYTFEVTATDDYGVSTSVAKTVIIGTEPNASPVVILEVRKGS